MDGKLERKSFLEAREEDYHYDTDDDITTLGKLTVLRDLSQPSRGTRGESQGEG